MSDKKVIDLEFRASGNAVFDLKAMRTEAQRATQALDAMGEARRRALAQGGQGTPITLPGSTYGLAQQSPLMARWAAQRASSGAPAAIPLPQPPQAIPIPTAQVARAAPPSLAAAVPAGAPSSATRTAGGPQSKPASRGGGGLGIPGLGGMAGGPAVALTASLAALHLVTEGMQRTAEAAKILNSATQSTAQKFEGLAGQIPLVGAALVAAVNLYKGVSGVDAKLEKAAFDHSLGVGEVGARAAAQRQQDQLRQTQTGYQAQAEAFQQMPAYQLGPTARTTLAEQLKYQEGQQLKPHEDQLVIARAKAHAAATEAAGAGQLRDQSARVLASYAAADRPLERRPMNTDEIAGIKFGEGKPMGAGGVEGVAQRAAPFAAGVNPDAGALWGVGKKLVTDPRSLTVQDVGTTMEEGSKALPGVGPLIGAHVQAFKAEENEVGALAAVKKSIDGQVEAYKKVSGQMQDNLRITTERSRLEGLTTDATNKNLAAVRAGAEVKKLEVAYAREELGILQQREKIAQSNAQRLGMMSKMQRKRSVDALEQVQKIGFGAAPQFLRESAARIAPRTIANLAEQYGEKTPEFERLRRLTPEFRDKLSDIRPQVDAKQKQVGSDERFNFADEATKIAASFEKGARRLSELIDQKINTAINKIILDQRYGAANKH